MCNSSGTLQELCGKDTSVLMGANIANEVAAGCFCETTIGYRVEANGKLLKEVFDNRYFKVGLADNVPGESKGWVEVRMLLV